MLLKTSVSPGRKLSDSRLAAVACANGVFTSAYSIGLGDGCHQHLEGDAAGIDAVFFSRADKALYEVNQPGWCK